jgi:hypothetical protein
MKRPSHVPSSPMAFLAALALLSAGAAADATEALSLQGKTVTIVVGTTTGGTTDFSARLMGQYLAKYLPGAPTVIVQNRPGAHALNALSYFAQQAKPDGLTLAVGSITELDPQNYRVAQSHYDPSTFAMLGGVELGGGILIIRQEARPRLLDKSAAPVSMGSVSGYPHVTMLMTAWGIDYLGWNARWVQGYPSETASVVLALERGEVDMTGFSATGLSDPLLDRSKYAIIYQTGSHAGMVPSPLPAIAATPLFTAAMRGKIADPLAQKAFDYWRNTSSVINWAALPPGTPTDIVDTYRTAFAKAAADPGLTVQGKNFSRDFSTVSWQNLVATVRALADTSPEILGFMPEMLRRQGLKVQ